MRRSHRTALLFVGLALAGYFVTSALASSMTPPEEVTPGTGAEKDTDALPSPDPLLASPSPAPEDSPDGPEPEVAGETAGGTFRSYAIALYELPGLPPDAESGTKVEVWATWKPPITKDRQVQKLIEGATLERVTPALTPEGPPVAILSVPENQLDELLFGDRFGALSAAVVP